MFAFACKNNVLFSYLQENHPESNKDIIWFLQNVLLGAYAPLDIQENLRRWPENLTQKIIIFRTQRR